MDSMELHRALRKRKGRLHKVLPAPFLLHAAM
jgi:hypothetical protein